MSTKRKTSTAVAFQAPPPVPLTPAEEMRVTWLSCLVDQMTARRQLANAIREVRNTLDDLTRTAVERAGEPRSGQTGVFQCSVAEVEYLAARIPALIDAQQKIEGLAAAFGVPLVLTDVERERYLPPSQAPEPGQPTS